ncbi:MAG: hypothetical protein ACI9R3_003726 [Verrucomicrobiales bacterium]|jgi:hypothetical protein
MMGDFHSTAQAAGEMQAQAPEPEPEQVPEQVPGRCRRRRLDARRLHFHGADVMGWMDERRGVGVPREFRDFIFDRVRPSPADASKAGARGRSPLRASSDGFEGRHR